MQGATQVCILIDKKKTPFFLLVEYMYAIGGTIIPLHIAPHGHLTLAKSRNKPMISINIIKIISCK
jgi:hypothetical protein